MILRLVCFLIIAGIISSCSPRVSSTISNKQTFLPDTTIVAFVMMNEPFQKEGLLIGSVAVGDNGLSTKCSYHQVLNILKSEALSNGANLIKVTEHREPDALSSCHRMRATLYRVDDPRKFEREITWSKWRRLTWEDFKGVPDETGGDTQAAVTTCGFGFQASRRIGGRTRIAAQNTFDCYKSWVRPEYKGHSALLEHEQKHFDLCEVYARELRKRLSGPNLSIYGFSDASATIFMEVYNEYLEQQRIYDEETKHGLNKEMQEKWNRLIAARLDSTEQEN